jgi:dihydrofolate reductase
VGSGQQDDNAQRVASYRRGESKQTAPQQSEAPRAASSRPRLSLIVAASQNNIIGRNGELPWRLPADLAHFKRLTMGAAILMGRKTYDSIGRPLPGRKSIVLTRDTAWRAIHDAPLPEGLLVVDSLDMAIEVAIALAAQAEVQNADEVFVIGGGEIYRLALPQADRVYLTRVHTTVEGDAAFPALDPTEWRLTSSEDHPADERNKHPCTFEVWERQTS